MYETGKKGWGGGTYAEEIPEHLLDALLRYGQKRIPTGGFLRAVLSNDLFEAVARADENSLKALRNIITFIRWEMPSECRGSSEKVDKWLKGREG